MKKLLELDKKSTMGIFSQLDIWEIVVDYLKLDKYENKMNISLVFCVSNICDFLIFVFVREKQISDFLLNSTDLLQYILKWLKLFFKSDFKEKEILNDVLENLLKLIHICFILNEDLSLLFLNKTFLAKKNNKNTKNNEIINEKMNSYINIYKEFSFAINQTSSIPLKISIFNIISLITPKWPYAREILNFKDENNEKIGEKIILSLFSFYKENITKYKEKKIYNEEYINRKSMSLNCISSLILINEICKNTFIISGFFNEIIKEFNNKIDDCRIDEGEKIIKTKDRTSIKKLFSKSNNNEKQQKYEELDDYLKIFIYLFYEKDETIYDYNEVLGFII